jgi:alcohol oxidase
MKSYRGDNALSHPKFPAGSVAEAKYFEGPVDIDCPDIAYSKEDDEAIDQFHRETVSTIGHSVCITCMIFID